MNIPKLRFKEFNDEWQTHKLKDFFSKITEKNKSNLIHNVISNSAKFGLVKQIDYFSKDIANDNNIEGYFIIKTNDFVYNPRKSSEAPFGPICKYNYTEAGIVSPLYLCFRYSQPINYNFFEYLFKSPVWYKYIYQNGDSGARHDRVNIKDNTFFLMPISIPQSKEQQKIADFLFTVDKKIENLNATIENLEQQKKGLMQQIFSQKLRFKDETDNNNHISTNLYKLIKDIKSGTNKERNKTGLFPVYGSMGILGYNNKYIYDFTTLLIARVGVNAGNISLVTGKFDVSDNTLIIIPSNKVNIYYLYYYLINFNLNKLVFGSGQPLIKASELKKVIIKIPCLEEQQKIANFLSTFDRKIDNQKAQLEHWQQIKKGLLQQMFV